MSTENLRITDNTIKITGTTEGYPYVVSPHTVVSLGNTKKILYKDRKIVILKKPGYNDKAVVKE